MFQQDFLYDVMAYANVHYAHWNPKSKVESFIGYAAESLTRTAPMLAMLGTEDIEVYIRKIISKRFTAKEDMSTEMLYAICRDILRYQKSDDITFVDWLIMCDFEVQIERNRKTLIPALYGFVTHMIYNQSYSVWSVFANGPVPEIPKVLVRFLDKHPDLECSKLRRQQGISIKWITDMYATLTFFGYSVDFERLIEKAKLPVKQICESEYLKDLSEAQFLVIFDTSKWPKYRNQLKQYRPELIRYGDLEHVFYNWNTITNYDPLWILTNYDNDSLLRNFLMENKNTMILDDGILGILFSFFKKMAKRPHFATLPERQQTMLKRIAYETVIKRSHVFAIRKRKIKVKEWLKVNKNGTPIPCKETEAYLSYGHTPTDEFEKLLVNSAENNSVKSK